MTEPLPENPHLARRQARWRLAGWMLLVTGCLAAGVVYWVGTHSARPDEDAALSGYYKTQARNMQLMSGSLGEVMEDFTNDLKQPGTQAFLIVGSSVTLMAGCFFVARRVQ